MARSNSDSLKDLLKVYFIMGSTNCTKNPAEVLKEAIAGGITLFQYREKGKGALAGDKKYELAKELQSICIENHIPFIINDDIDLAMALNADGVHIGQEDDPVEMVREKIGDKTLGISVHTYEEAMTSIQAGADYFGIGPIYPTNTKEDVRSVQGTYLIEEIRKKGLKTPIVGIGGITAENAKPVIKAGADGVSVITAISHAESISDAAAELRKNVFR
ncbi:thiamine phosphate synthase [Peribacillus cavernae]|uniref:Thiamine-phosphate synthase n=1 Tax=Peribacillus cavernae TaxID=1674310 RepID=A0A433HRW6_9BACI|nr:thiamine phosphate synthase [Peribacillus cavernae]MDQ0220639.1 thiamine-phosphate pyrophosphorylase [Peribacillus cavernae]RUQ31099.1 thiamine phosphate synthase [Peribacillus cavernae]